MFEHLNAVNKEWNPTKIQIVSTGKIEISPSKKLINSSIKLINRSDSVFYGNLSTSYPEGLKSLTQNTQSIEIPAGDSIYIPIKFLLLKNFIEGNIEINHFVFDNNKKQVNQHKSLFKIEEERHLSLLTDKSYFITNENDSVSIKVFVKNGGNKAQDVKVVFNIQTINEKNNLIEQNATVEAFSQHLLTLSFVPSPELIRESQFNISITGFYKKDNEYFDNSIIEVRNLIANKNYSNSYNNLNDNTFAKTDFITLSYRNYWETSNLFQVKMAKNIDLPAGYLNLKGNLYSRYSLRSSQKTFSANNTSLSYIYNKNTFVVGNISETMEMSIYGRGAKVKLVDEDNNKSLTVGAIDINHNLFSSNSLFSNNYCYYAIGEMGYKKLTKINFTSAYKVNDYEKSKAGLLGASTIYQANNNWRFDVRTHLSPVLIKDLNDKQNKSMEYSSELIFNGIIGKSDIMSSIYKSSSLFPGNRRGMLSFFNTVSTKLSKKYSLHSSLYYYKLSPKSFLSSNYKSSNFNYEASFSMPIRKNAHGNISYIHQTERSNTYRFISENETQLSKMSSENIKTDFWYKIKTEHSLNISLEYGIVKSSDTNSDNKKLSNHSKTSLYYIFNNFSINAIYQNGSYYLSELLYSLEGDKKYYRLSASSSYNQKFINDNLNLRLGLNINKNLLSSFTPSVNFNINYKMRNNLSVFLDFNYQHYNYDFSQLKDMLNMEIGFTYNFKSYKPYSKKKSNIKAFAFYDLNSNGKFDNNEKRANNVKVKFGNSISLTKDNGKISYSKVPFGKYKIDFISDKEWYYEGDSINVNKFKTEINIPLQRSGTAIGYIKFEESDTRLIKDLYNSEGISFIVKDLNNNVIRKIISDMDGKLTIFLPTGEYTIELEKETLNKNYICNTPIQKFKVNPREISKIADFILIQRKKKVNIKYFSE